jgi:hypothetical protein
MLLVFVIVPRLIGDVTRACATEGEIFDVTEEECAVVRLFADCADRSGS